LRVFFCLPIAAFVAATVAAACFPSSQRPFTQLRPLMALLTLTMLSKARPSRWSTCTAAEHLFCARQQPDATCVAPDT
jgi:hypothetical protein